MVDLKKHVVLTGDRLGRCNFFVEVEEESDESKESEERNENDERE